jgi:lipoate-protein ligase A
MSLPSQQTAWRVLDSGPGAGSLNMRLDEEYARALQRGEGSQLLRLYSWSPWAISLGHNQREHDIDLTACSRDGIDVVRRPTGGRAILHAEELTYCIVMYAGRRSVLDVYNAVSRALVRGLALFGVEASLQKSQPDFPAAYRLASSVPCFTSSARYEIEVDGRKLVGSAQRRFADGEHDVVLQHGSILCGPAHRRLVEYLASNDERILERLRTEMREKTVDLHEILAGPVDRSGLARAIIRGFEEEWEITVAGPPDADAAHAESAGRGVDGGSITLRK